MRINKLTWIFLFTAHVVLGQFKEEATKLVEEGIVCHDKGDYRGAIARYDKALEMDKDNVLALTEKAITLLAMQKFSDAIQCCEKTIEISPGKKGPDALYVAYGNALDGLGKAEKALDVYDRGIGYYPGFYQLHFNKGITLAGMDKPEEAMVCFQQSMILNPKHPGSHNAMGRISKNNNKRIPALLALTRFLVIEPASNRAIENLETLRGILKGDVKETGKNAITINISPDMLSGGDGADSTEENNFASIDLMLAMTSASDYSKKGKKNTEVGKFIEKMEMICSMMEETKKDHTGFFWDYYVPYFIEMKNKKMLEACAHIVFSSTDERSVNSWMKAHQRDIENFYNWSNSFSWKKN